MDGLEKTIAEISVRGKYQMSILAIKENGEILPLPKADHVFREEEHLIVAAKKNDLVKLIKKI